MICPKEEEQKINDLELQRSNSEVRANVMWRSCCIELNRDFTVFFTKYIILIGLMVFFSAELHLSITCEDKQLFMSLLTLIIGVAIPSPRLANK